MIKTIKPPRELLSRRDAAEYLGIKPQTLAVWAWHRRHDLPYVRVGGRAMYRRSDLEAFVVANLVGGAAA